MGGEGISAVVDDCDNHVFKVYISKAIYFKDYSSIVVTDIKANDTSVILNDFVYKL